MLLLVLLHIRMARLSNSGISESRDSLLQKRIEELERYKAILEADLESKQVTVQQLVAASQNPRRANDELMEERNGLSTIPEEDD